MVTPGTFGLQSGGIGVSDGGGTGAGADTTGDTTGVATDALVWITYEFQSEFGTTGPGLCLNILHLFVFGSLRAVEVTYP